MSNKESQYDNEEFFSEYMKMERSVKGPEGAGEWYRFREMFPDVVGKRVLDLGSGMGWHIKYALDNGAHFVTGIETSEKMTGKAMELLKGYKNFEILNISMEDINGTEEYDIVISSLAVHYIEDFKRLCSKVHSILKPNGTFLLSFEHPVFTAEGSQNFKTDCNGNKFWPVDKYFDEGKRDTAFLGHSVVKYHRTTETYVMDLINAGFKIIEIAEPKPDIKFMDRQWFSDELQRPMMMIIKTDRK